MNSLTDYDWLVSYRAVTGSLFLSIDTDLQICDGDSKEDFNEHTYDYVPQSCSVVGRFDKRDFIEQTSRSALLQEIVKRDLFASLSREAKDVIRLVLNTPVELLASVTSPRGRMPYVPKKEEVPSLNLLACYLRWNPKWYWKNKKIYSVFNEIKAFVKSF